MVENSKSSGAGLRMPRPHYAANAMHDAPKLCMDGCGCFSLRVASVGQGIGLQGCKTTLQVTTGNCCRASTCEMTSGNCRRASTCAQLLDIAPTTFRGLRSRLPY